MTLLEFLQQRWISESPAFQGVFEALPLSEFAYRPHERSPSAAQILWTPALEAKACSDLIDTGQSDWAPDPPPAEPEKIVAAFERYRSELGERLGGLDESRWENMARFLVH
jgi:hypothetical protein